MLVQMSDITSKAEEMPQTSRYSILMLIKFPQKQKCSSVQAEVKNSIYFLFMFLQ